MIIVIGMGIVAYGLCYLWGKKLGVDVRNGQGGGSTDGPATG